MTQFFESLAQDLRYAARGLRRNPLFTLTAVFAAALGIGSTTAVFSVVDRILFRSLPYPHDERLVSLGMMAPLDPNEFLFAQNYFDWRKYQTPFESTTSFLASTRDCDLTQTNPVRLSCADVEGNFLTALGRPPLLGRSFTPQEDKPGASKTALLAYGVWRSRFGGNPGVIGKVISLDGQPVTIVGVLPPDFEMPTLSTADLLMPSQLNQSTNFNGVLLRVFGRLKAGVSVPQAQAAMQPLFARALETVPPQFRKEVFLRVRSLRDRQVQDSRRASWVLIAAVLSVLLIACANIANLLLARSTSRQKELAVRAALGAGRSRLIRQSLTEAALLGILGGVAGYGVAWGLLRLFIGIAPGGIPRLEQASLDGRVLLFTMAGSLLSGFIFGLAPALQKARSEVLAGWRSTGAPRLMLRECLVAGQIAVSVVLLTSAGMLLRSLWKIESVPRGMETEHVVTAEFTAGKQPYSDNKRLLQFFDDLQNRIQLIPGASAAAISDSMPPSGVTRARPFSTIPIEGQPPFTQGTGGVVVWRYVSPGYFSTLGIPIVRGRGFTEQDRTGAEQTVVLSESLARRMVPNGDVIGKRLLIDGGERVIGIARDVRDGGPMESPNPEFYVVRRRSPDAIFTNQQPPVGWRHAFVAIRTPMDSRVMSEWIRKALSDVNPEMPVLVSTMHQRVDKLAARPRFNALLLVLFAGAGVLLATIGLYGVMAFLVGQRTQEIGVRMALGATPADITQMVLSRAARWTIAGLVGGLVGSLFATRILRTMLFEIPERDPLTFGVVLPLLLLIALAAAWIPSRRASRVHPMTALRHE